MKIHEYTIKSYGNNKFEVQNMTTEDPYKVVKGIFDKYTDAEEAIEIFKSGKHILNLTCCCCGNSAPALKQWWNRDTGYGLCNKCADWISKKEDAETMKSYYGIKGIHYGLSIWQIKQNQK